MNKEMQQTEEFKLKAEQHGERIKELEFLHQSEKSSLIEKVQAAKNDFEDLKKEFEAYKVKAQTFIEKPIANRSLEMEQQLMKSRREKE